MNTRFIRMFTGIVLVFALSIQTGSRLLAQAVAIATVTGRVTDPQSAVLPGVQIRLTAIEAGLQDKEASPSILTALVIGSPEFQRR